MKEALRPGGIVCSQAGSIWCNLDTSTSTYTHCKNVFAKSAYAYASVPTYPSGQIGFVLGSTNPVRILFLTGNIHHNGNILIFFFLRKPTFQNLRTFCLKKYWRRKTYVIILRVYTHQHLLCLVRIRNSSYELTSPCSFCHFQNVHGCE